VTTIRYTLPFQSQVIKAIYDLNGRRVTLLILATNWLVSIGQSGTVVIVAART
jgi:hypothetical protein